MHIKVLRFADKSRTCAVRPLRAIITNLDLKRQMTTEERQPPNRPRIDSESTSSRPRIDPESIPNRSRIDSEFGYVSFASVSLMVRRRVSVPAGFCTDGVSVPAGFCTGGIMYHHIVILSYHHIIIASYRRIIIHHIIIFYCMSRSSKQHMALMQGAHYWAMEILT